MLTIQERIDAEVKNGFVHRELLQDCAKEIERLEEENGHLKHAKTELANLNVAGHKIGDWARLTEQLAFESQFPAKLKELGFDERLIEEYSSQKMKIRTLEAKVEAQASFIKKLQQALYIAAGSKTLGEVIDSWKTNTDEKDALSTRTPEEDKAK